MRTPLTHGDADMCRPKRWCVVSTVPRDGHEMTQANQRFYDLKLLIRLDAGEHARVADERVDC